MRDLKYRYFRLKNYRNEIFDITGNFGHTPFFANPAGLGFGYNITTEQIESKAKVLVKKSILDSIVGEMYFKNYSEYEQFTEYIRSSQINNNLLRMYYARTDVEVEYYYEVLMQNLNLAEKNKTGYIVSSISFSKLSTKLTDKVITVSNKVAYVENIEERQARITIISVLDYAVSFAVLKPIAEEWQVLVSTSNNVEQVVNLPESRTVSKFIINLQPDTEYTLLLKSPNDNITEASFKTKNEYVVNGVEGDLIQTEFTDSDIKFERYFKAPSGTFPPNIEFVGVKNSSLLLKTTDQHPDVQIVNYSMFEDFGADNLVQNSIIYAYLSKNLTDDLAFTILANPGTAEKYNGLKPKASEYPDYIYPVGTKGVKYKLYGYSSITSESLKLIVNSKNYSIVSAKITISGSFTNPKWTSNRLNPYNNSSIPMSGSYLTADGNGTLVIDSDYINPYIQLNGFDISELSDKSLSEFMYILPGMNEITFNLSASSVTNVKIEYKEESDG